MYTLDQAHSPAYTPGRQGNPISGIVIHHWGNTGQTHAGVVAYLTRNGATTSAHYVASSGHVTQIVQDTDTAWHAGDWQTNLKTIGIECRPECDPQDFVTVAELIAHLRSLYGPLPVTGHKDYFATACPGVWYPRLKELSDLANTTQTNTTPQTVKGNANTMRLIKTTTPWNSDAYCLITDQAGAYGLNDVMAQVYAGGLGDYSTVPWDHYQALVKEAWQRRNDLVTALGGKVEETLDQAVNRVLNLSKQEQTTN